LEKEGKKKRHARATAPKEKIGSIAVMNLNRKKRGKKKDSL